MIIVRGERFSFVVIFVFMHKWDVWVLILMFCYIWFWGLKQVAKRVLSLFCALVFVSWKVCMLCCFSFYSPFFGCLMSKKFWFLVWKLIVWFWFVLGFWGGRGSMQKGKKSKCTSMSHHLLMDNAKTRLNDLHERFSNLQAARKEGWNSDVAVLEEQVYQGLREWKAELDVPSPANSLLVSISYLLLWIMKYLYCLSVWCCL